MNETEFEKDILDVLKKHGYKTDGIKNLCLKCSVDNIPEVEIGYFII